MKPRDVAEYLYSHSFPRFCLVGSIGFLVDAGLLVLLYESTGLSVTLSRLISFSMALTVTWLLNRHITFRHGASARKFGEWQRYVAVNSIGGALNLAVFFWMTHTVCGSAANLIPALITASVIALAFNYTGSRILVFNTHHNR